MRHLLQLVVFLTFIACQSEMNKGELSNNENDRQFGDNEAIQCQYLWYGDCNYQLCETINWKAFPDSTKDGNTMILVKYIPDNRYVRHKKPIMIYSKVFVNESNPDLTLNGYIEEEEKNAIKNGEKVTELAKISTSDSNIAFVKGYISEKESKYYSIAYIDQSKYIIIITYCAQEINDYNENYYAFENIVKSFKYIIASPIGNNNPNPNHMVTEDGDSIFICK